MKVRKSQLGLGLLGLIVLFAWVRIIWFSEQSHFRLPQDNESNRNALLAIYEAVHLGDSHDIVLNAYWKYRSEELHLRADSPSSWTITMPLEFLASDWNLRIGFAEGMVSEVKIRTSDGPQTQNMPKDKVIE